MKRFVLFGAGSCRLYAHEWVPRHATDYKLVADGSRTDDSVRSPNSSIAPYRHADGPIIERSVRPWVGSSTRLISTDRSPRRTFVMVGALTATELRLAIGTIHGQTRTKPPYPSNVHFSPGKISMAAAATKPWPTCWAVSAASYPSFLPVFYHRRTRGSKMESPRPTAEPTNCRPGYPLRPAWLPPARIPP